jgi:hypothetical protein
MTAGSSTTSAGWSVDTYARFRLATNVPAAAVARSAFDVD